MSHYSVAVITDKDTTVEELLAPYDENISVEKRLLYTREDLIRNARSHLDRFYNARYIPYKNDPEGFLKTECDGDKGSQLYKYTMSFMDRYNETDEQLLQRELEYYDEDMKDEDGNVYTVRNPDSKWDWYAIGGRFNGMLIDKKSGKIRNELPAKNIDFQKMWENAKYEMEPYEGALTDSWYKPEYLKRIYPDEATYERIATTFWTRAVVTPDGQWHEIGEMGWFGFSSEEPEETIRWVSNYYDQFIDPAIEYGCTIHIVDCHI